MLCKCTMTNYSTHFTGVDLGFPTRKGGGLVHCDRACIGQQISCRWCGGGGMQEEGAGGGERGKGEEGEGIRCHEVTGNLLKIIIVGDQGLK